MWAPTSRLRFVSEHSVEQLERRAMLTGSADLDGDGDVDLYNDIAWFENSDGNGSFILRDAAGSSSRLFI